MTFGPCRPELRDFVKLQLEFDPMDNGKWCRANVTATDWDIMTVDVEIQSTPPVGVPKKHTLPMESPLLREVQHYTSNSYNSNSYTSDSYTGYHQASSPPSYNASGGSWASRYELVRVDLR